MMLYRYDEGESPLDHLDHAAHCYATALKSKSKDCTLHLSLAMVLEERYNAEDILGLKKEAVRNYLYTNYLF